MNDAVNSPNHYTQQVPGIECLDVIEHFPLLRGNAIKYLWRAGAKGDAVQDLRKAIVYIQREIDALEKAAAPEAPTMPTGDYMTLRPAGRAPSFQNWCAAQSWITGGLDEEPR